MAQGQYFRANAGVVVIDGTGKVLVLERSDVQGAWQFPQGGIKEHEEPIEAAWRELNEETGLDQSLVEIVAEYPEWLVYELPPEARKEKTGRGQAQRWFAFRYTGPDSNISLDRGEREFARFAWVSPSEAVERTVSFRRHVYRAVIDFLRERRLVEDG